MEKVIRFVEDNQQRNLDDLMEILRIPSISSSTEYKPEVVRCADHLAMRMHETGAARVDVFPTEGHPIVYSEFGAGRAKPTVLVYGHYDVQPVDPVDLWTSPPFEPQVRDGRLYARGATDDKGQLYTHLKAVQAYLRTVGDLPVNVKFIVEGEEEVGSTSLEGFLRAHKEMLAADWVVISDTPMFGKNMPSICYGLRGICYMEIGVKGPGMDLHSGSFGGIVPNPVNVLCEIIASMKDKAGRVQIPGFYDDVIQISQEEREALARLPLDTETLRAAAGVKQLTGELGYTDLERMWARPTLDCNGIWGGYSGEGAKTIIPSWAKAKISMRLVANQDPEKIAELFAHYVREVAPASIGIEVRSLHGGKGFLTPIEHPAVKAAARALERAFGVRTLYIREGGSIPFVATIHEIFRTPCLLVGFGHPEENSHAPDEHMYLDHYFSGIKAAAILYQELSLL
ncbi:MAG: dipeptidase [Acidobacteriota bacterium]